MQEMINVGVRSIHIKTTTVQVPKQSTVGQLKSKVRRLVVIESRVGSNMQKHSF